MVRKMLHLKIHTRGGNKNAGVQSDESKIQNYIIKFRLKMRCRLLYFQELREKMLVICIRNNGINSTSRHTGYPFRATTSCRKDFRELLTTEKRLIGFKVGELSDSFPFYFMTTKSCLRIQCIVTTKPSIYKNYSFLYTPSHQTQTTFALMPSTLSFSAYI